MSKERTQIDRFLTNTHLGEGKALKVKTVYNTWANPPATGAEVLGFERVYALRYPLVRHKRDHQVYMFNANSTLAHASECAHGAFPQMFSFARRA